MPTVIVNARFLTQQVTGVQRFAIEISLLLKQEFAHIIFVSPKKIKNPVIANLLEVCVFGSFNGHLWEQVELPIFVKRYPGAVLVNLCNTAPVLYQKKIVAIHDLAFYHHPEWFSFAFRNFYNLMIPQIIKSSQMIVTVSEASKSDLIKSYSIQPDKIKVIYNGVNPDLQKTLILGSVKVPEVLNRKAMEPYILAVSSLDPRKNFNRLLAAFRNLTDKSFNLIIVGSANANFSKTGADQNLLPDENIKFTGYVSDEDLIYLYTHAFAFIYPSLYEGFGIPPLEAMACGCPTIVSDIPSLREVCGPASYYINPEDTASMTAGLKELMQNPELRLKLKQLGLERIKKFSWAHSIPALKEIINLVCQNQVGKENNRPVLKSEF